MNEVLNSMNRLQTLLGEGKLTVEDIAKTFDHALLAPTLTDEEMRKDLRAIRGFPLASVCIKPYAIPIAIEELADSNIAVGTVIGFPHGSNLPAVKAFEAELAFKSGAKEMDMVVNVGKVLDEDWQAVSDDIRAVLEVVRARNGVLKVIFETDFIREDRLKIRLCEICTELKVDYVKTSTGFGFVKNSDGAHSYAGATEHDLRLMREHIGAEIGLKASGGIRSLAMVLKCIELGCDRIGLSATKSLLEAAKQGHLNDKIEGVGY